MNPIGVGKFRYTMISILSVLITFIIMTGCSGSGKWQVISPDGKLVINVTRDAEQALFYTVTFNGQVAIETSALGMQLSNTDLSTGLQFTGKSPVEQITDDYTLVSGKQRQCSNQANQLTLSFENDQAVPLQVILRAYNDGVAFRYGLTAPGGEKAEVIGEATQFNMPTPGMAYISPYDTVARWAPAYETIYDAVKIGTPADPNKNGWGFPLLFHVGNMWTLISESDLQAGYCGMHLDARCEDGVYSMRLPLANEADPAKTNKPVISGEVLTPWRFINIASTLSGIVESNLVTDLASPSTLDDVSWIKPGVASWGWWSGASARSYREMKQYVDFAADMGWRYSLVDAGWPDMKGGDLQKLARYATSRGVEILAWYPSGTLPGLDQTGDPVVVNDPELRRAEFAKLEKWGVRGIKVDYFVTDKPYAIQLYHDILQDAAEHHLVVNFHGCTLPRGWRRTYPNLLTMEAICGCEAYKYNSDYPRLAAKHMTIAAISRNAVGPMDYTPTAFSNNKFPHQTTYGFELALSALLESGIIHYSDSDEMYRSMPGYVLEFMQNIPATWDEVRYIDGTPGEFMVLARRHGDTWYVAGINALKTRKQVTLDLSMLGNGYKSISLIADGPNSTALGQTKMTLTDNLFSVNMLPNGGFVGVVNKQ